MKNIISKYGYCELLNTEIDEVISLLVAVEGNKKYSTLTELLTPKSKIDSKNFSLSSCFGLSMFPLHTDKAAERVPPKYILLKNASERDIHTKTILVDFFELKNDECWDKISNSIWYVSGGREKFYTSLIESSLSKSEQILRFNPLIMKPLSPMNIQKVIEKINNLKRIEISWTKDKIVVINNWRLLHGRDEIIKGEEQFRKLERTSIIF